MEERTYFPFLLSWVEAISYLPRKEQGEAVLAIVRYGLYGTDPDPLPSGGAMTAYLMAKPTLDASRKKAISGAAGGRANGKQTGSKSEANPKQTASNDEANGEANAKLKININNNIKEKKINKRKEPNACVLLHGEVSPLMQEAARRLLEEEQA